MKVLQINSVCGTGSTGRIATDIADLLLEQGHDCRIAYGRGAVAEKYQPLAVRIGSELDNKIHGVQTRLLDQHGFGSKKATRAFLKWVDEYDPDLIHLHNIHGYYINIELLFEYLKRCGKPVIWTLHDCWAMTGHCAHFSAVGCDQWKKECRRCGQLREYPATLLSGNVAENYKRKKRAFTGVSNLTIITPSHWLASVVKESFLGEYPVVPIYNGVDLQVFKPTQSDFRARYGLEDKRMLLGVANIWDAKKGLDDFVALSERLDDSCKIVLVGLNEEQIHGLPEKIIKLPRTDSLEELAAIYSAADVFINPSIEETMGLTTAEALACGTPVITYNKTAVPEVADETCGMVVDCDPQAICEALEKINFKKEDCLQRAAFFEKKKQYLEYLRIYEMSKKRI
ncbi:MAG: glycosyltransferase [Clostridia bacterium]|nr:glycosyltransferase [Clostridia bacterium]